jgi:L-arabinokinase
VTIAFYISGHGFGHASRQVEIINALWRRRQDLRVIVRSAVSPDLLARTLLAPYELRPGAPDTGIVQIDSVTHDDEATAREAVRFYRDFDSRAEAEARAFANDRVRLVVGDIPPLAFDVAARLRVPSVAIANFTWDWIYEAHPALAEAAPWLLPLIRRAYGSATRALELPFSGGFSVFPAVQRIPLVGRRSTQSRANTRSYFGLPADGPVALLSFGGYGLPSLDLAGLDCLDRWTVVTTDRITSSEATLPPAVVFILERRFVGGGFRYEDLVAAADVVVTKPGYGIIAECLANHTAMLYTSRGHFREYDVLVRDLAQFVRARFIARGDFFAGRWRRALDSLAAQPQPPKAMAVNGAEVAAGVIESLVVRQWG